ncbi:MAG TPA: hypothetical protein VGJ26_22285, partial [Pirellulales bacterium]
MARLLSALVVCLALVIFGSLRAAAEEPTPKRRFVIPASFQMEMPNVVAPTLGGNQLWEDEVYFGRWRIQRNVLTLHRRLLDPHDVRHASGSLEVCQRRLEELKKERSLQPTRGKVVVMLHGLMGSRLMMVPLAKYLERNGDYTVISLTYASTRAAVSEHAQALGGLVASLDQATEINFVAHSLGNLVVRHYMADCQAGGDELDPRINRFVMIGPPNHGARMAVLLGGNPIFDTTLGMSAQQLGRRWDELAPHLATPPCEFGIIAGGKGNRSGLSPLLEGDDDGTVRVAEARLAGASDFTIVE